MEPLSSRRSIRLAEYDYSLNGAYFITICVEQKEHRFGHITDGSMRLNQAGYMVEERILAIPAKFPGTLIDSFVVMPNHIHLIITLSGQKPNDGSIPDGGNTLPDESIPDGGNTLADESIPDGEHVGAGHRARPLSDTNVAADTLLFAKNDSPGVEAPGVEAPGVEAPGVEAPGVEAPDNILGPIGGPDGPKAGTHEGAPLHVYDPVCNLSDVVGWFKASSTNYYIKGVKAGTYPAFDRRLWQRNYYEHIIRTDTAYKLIEEYIRTNPQRWAEDRLR